MTSPQFPHRSPPPPTPEQIRSQIETLGVTQEAYARLIHVDRRSVLRWLAGERRMPLAPYRYIRLRMAVDVASAAQPDLVAQILELADIEPLPVVPTRPATTHQDAPAGDPATLQAAANPDRL